MQSTTTTHYPASLEGVFDSAEAAFAAIGAPTALIECSLANSKIEQSQIIALAAQFGTRDAPYLALAMPTEDGRFQLMRGCIGLAGTFDEAKEAAHELSKSTGRDMAVVEWTSAADRVRQ